MCLHHEVASSELYFFPDNSSFKTSWITAFTAAGRNLFSPKIIENLRLQSCRINKFDVETHFRAKMNVNKPDYFDNNVINLLVLEVGSYIVRIRQVLGHFVMLESLNRLRKKNGGDQASFPWRREGDKLVPRTDGLRCLVSAEGWGGGGGGGNSYMKGAEMLVVWHPRPFHMRVLHPGFVSTFTAVYPGSKGQSS